VVAYDDPIDLTYVLGRAMDRFALFLGTEQLERKRDQKEQTTATATDVKVAMEVERHPWASEIAWDEQRNYQLPAQL
jgi:hypothetical protein